MARHIHSIHVQGFRCLKDVTFELTDLHAFIGPNDSGKTTLLEAVREAAAMAYAVPTSAAMLRVSYDQELEGKGSAGTGPTWKQRGAAVSPKLGRSFGEKLSQRTPIVRLDPDRLRPPTQLIRSTQGSVWFSDDRGSGLAAVYDVLLNRKLKQFLAIQESVRELFPTVDELVLDTPDEKSKSIGVRLRDGTAVGAQFLSEGLLYYLAYAAMQYIGPTPILLVEEPENGLHPARIADVIRVLREIAKDSQVILATHSPIVVNELTADEVSVVTRDPESGTKVTRLKDTPRFDERSKIFELGELWLAYANGDDEAPLLEGTGPT